MKEKLTTVVFDIGQVLNEYDAYGCIKAYSKDEDQAKRVLEETFGEKGLWHEFDRGVIPVDELYRQAQELYPEDAQAIHCFFDHFSDTFVPLERSEGWIKDLKNRGYKTLYLSNYSDYLIQRTLKTLYFLPLMDGGLFSSRVKVIKPDSAYYMLLCDMYRVKPQECIFMDDNLVNVEGAKAVGMEAIHFTDYETTRAELESILRQRGSFGYIERI